ncbi:MAG: tetraacyldisaccharide 4'-kinase [Bacteroidales bacterium]|nr:tetraacyldisaccharide 4'-kinase [Bacteroidales bacterium]
MIFLLHTMKAIRLLLLPIAFLYWIPVKVRNFLFNINLLKGYSPDIPTICIGNITVGGTGKTPHSEYLIELLQTQFTVGLLSRGYKRKTKGFVQVETSATAKEVGDEPLQIKQKYPKTIVAVDEDRVNGANELIYRFPEMNVLLLDDAFQHRYIKPGLAILLTDYNNLIVNDYFLPAGRLRDSVSETKRANIIVVTKCPSTLTRNEMVKTHRSLKLNPNQQIYFTTVSYGTIKPIFDDGQTLAELNSTPTFYAIAGIANPSPFFDYLVKNYQIVGKKSYPDHHHFSEKEIQHIFEKNFRQNNWHELVITTEKDAARIKSLKLKPEIKKRLYYLSITIDFLNNDSEKFNKQIIEYVGKN